MTALDDIRAQLDRTSGMIEDYRRVVSDGTPIDLSGFDDSIGAMCAAIADLPPEQRPALKSALIRLMADLDTLVASLHQQHQALTQDLKGTSSRHKAVSAYGRGAAVPRSAGPKK